MQHHKAPASYKKMQRLSATQGVVYETGEPAVIVHSEDGHIYWMFTDSELVGRLAKGLDTLAAWLKREQGRSKPAFILPSIERNVEEMIRAGVLGL
jgi:hypothetical protein